MKGSYKYRMYGLVPYNISPIQQAIQFGHAVVEYSLEHYIGPYLQWANNDKTFIILNGGTTNSSELIPGTLNQNALYLKDIIKIPISKFHEPDLGDQLTAIAFLIDERIWDYEKYPKMPEQGTFWPNAQRSETKYYKNLWGEKDPTTLLKLREFISSFKLA